MLKEVEEVEVELGAEIKLGELGVETEVAPAVDHLQDLELDWHAERCCNIGSLYTISLIL